MGQTSAPESTDSPPTAPTQAPTQAPSGAAKDCGACAGCLWSTGACYADVDAAYCGSWADNHWCGGGSLSQVRPGMVHRHSNFLGTVLIQQTTRLEHITAEASANDEL